MKRCFIFFVLSIAVALFLSCSADDGISTKLSLKHSISAYYQSGGDVTRDSLVYSVTNSETPSVMVVNSGIFSLNNSRVMTESLVCELKDLNELNGGILVRDGSLLYLSDVTVDSIGYGINGIISCGSNSYADIKKVNITCSGNSSYCLNAFSGGNIKAELVNLKSVGRNSSAIYSNGSVNVSDGVICSENSEAVIIDCGSYTLFKNCYIKILSGGITGGSTGGTYDRTSDKSGILIYQKNSFSSHKERSYFTMDYGIIDYQVKNAPLFYVRNIRTSISLNNVDIKGINSGVLLKAEAGEGSLLSGEKIDIVLATKNQKLNGDIVLDSQSSINIELCSGSVFTGSVNNENRGEGASFYIDNESSWIATNDSYIDSLKIECEEDLLIERIDALPSVTIYCKKISEPSTIIKSYRLKRGGILILQE